eukprot:scaffold16440_cov97-Isochrysis_galbana.AAC.4
MVFREQLLDELNAAADAADNVADMVDALAATSLAQPQPRLATLGDFFPSGQEGKCPEQLDTARVVLRAAAASGLHDPWPRLDSRREPSSSRDASGAAWEEHAWQLQAWAGIASTAAAAGPTRPLSTSGHARLPDARPRTHATRGLRAALRVQEHALAQHKLRGSHRRAIGKHSRNEAHERERRAAPLAACGAVEAAGRRGRESEADLRLARMLGGSLQLSATEPQQVHINSGSGRGVRLVSRPKSLAARRSAGGDAKRGGWRVIH